MSPQFGDYQFEIYLDGLRGVTPSQPMDFAALEQRAQAALSPPSGPTSPGALATSTRSAPMCGPSIGTDSCPG